ncbi:hypothetical protein [Enterovirga sp.]|uniref:hypothetical protein n=1 Tax=Enterovirga sp. TaxID=2026350 RepID=UPI002D0A7D22|nr:hypothetical protein [Enterovirga sp.]HMO27853.1 hypothetical protein [Enterovirga sp.]
MIRKSYPSDVSDEEWALAASYLALLPEGPGQREHSLREVFDGLRHVVKTGGAMTLDARRPAALAYPQARRWLASGCFEAPDVTGSQLVAQMGQDGRLIDRSVDLAVGADKVASSLLEGHPRAGRDFTAARHRRGRLRIHSALRCITSESAGRKAD